MALEKDKKNKQPALGTKTKKLLKEFISNLPKNSAHPLSANDNDMQNAITEAEIVPTTSPFIANPPKKTATKLKKRFKKKFRGNTTKRQIKALWEELKNKLMNESVNPAEQKSQKPENEVKNPRPEDGALQMPPGRGLQAYPQRR